MTTPVLALNAPSSPNSGQNVERIRQAYLQGMAYAPSDGVIFNTPAEVYVGGTGDVTVIPAANGPGGVTTTAETFDTVNNSVHNALSNGNLTATQDNSNNWGISRSLSAMSSGKFYMEYTVTHLHGTSAEQISLGIATSSVAFSAELGHSSSGNSVGLTYDGTNLNVATNNGTVRFSTTGTAIADGDIIGLALDLTSGANVLTFYHNGTLVYSVNLTSIGIGALTWYFAVSLNTQTGGTAPVVTANWSAPVSTPAGFGNLAILGPGVLYASMQAGNMVPVRVLAVLATGTTATKLALCY